MTQPIRVPIVQGSLQGDLRQPAPPRGLILFAHGSGSSRFSPRNQAVAATLQALGYATLLIDLLTPEEERIDRATGELRFDIPMLAGRLGDIIDWLRADPEMAAWPLGLFGASTGAGAALMAAAARPADVAAVVSRGGRPDLAGPALERVTAPTLLIVGSLDDEVITLNQTAMRHMRGHVKLAIVPGATHLFEEPGTLERVAALAGEWFRDHMGQRTRAHTGGVR
jgi:putative phosphoribosyl transferase